MLNCYPAHCGINILGHTFKKQMHPLYQGDDLVYVVSD